MSSSTNSTTPDQYTAPVPLTPEELAALPHDGQAVKLLVSIWTLGFIATIFLSLRIYCRMIKGQRIWWDDAFLIASWVRLSNNKSPFGVPGCSCVFGC